MTLITLFVRNDSIKPNILPETTWPGMLVEKISMPKHVKRFWDIEGDSSSLAVLI